MTIEETNDITFTQGEEDKMYEIISVYSPSEDIIKDFIQEGSFVYNLKSYTFEELNKIDLPKNYITICCNPAYQDIVPTIDFINVIKKSLPEIFVYEDRDFTTLSLFDELKNEYKIQRIESIFIGSKIGKINFKTINSVEPIYLQIARAIKKVLDKKYKVTRSRKKDKIQKYELQQKQSLPLEIKIDMSIRRIREWHEAWDGEVYVSFSGGKDSTVLLHLVRSLYPNVPALFADTGLEYPEIRDFVKSIDNVVWMKPKMTFGEVLKNYGYPVASKKVARYIRDLQNPTEKNKAVRNLRLTGLNRKGKYLPSMKLAKKWLPLVDSKWKISEQCCDIMKKEPFHRYVKETGKKGINGVMACESDRREKDYLHNGCNAFNTAEPLSSPLGFWTEQDVLQYLRDYNVPYASVYGDIVEDENGKLTTTGERRTGCVFCMFGVHLEKGENRFQRMAKTHLKLYDYCINKLKLGEILDFIKVKYKPIEKTEQTNIDFNKSNYSKVTLINNKLTFE